MRKIKKKLNFLCITFLSVLLLAGCQTISGNSLDFENDPLEPMNRTIFSFNETMETAIIKPVAKGYRWAVPSFFRDIITNVFATLKQPAYLTNSLLQGELKDAGWVLVRTATNLSFGFFGMFDVATDMDIPAPDYDFGQTLAKWGWKEGGPYLVLPLLGPSNPRDAIGMGVDGLTDIVQWRIHDEHALVLSALGVNALNKYERGMDLLENLKNSSTDYYATLRTMYKQNRQKKIKQVIQTDEDTAELYEFDFEIEE